MKVYAGIGSRETPVDILDKMEFIGERFARDGVYLRTGNAKGADQAFARGANRADPTLVLLYLPWSGYEKEAIVKGNHYYFEKESIEVENKAIALVRKLHPAPEKLTRGALSLHIRNVYILLGRKLDRPVDAVYYWTKGGYPVGGTGMGLRIAWEFGIPTYLVTMEEGRRGILVNPPSDTDLPL